MFFFTWLCPLRHMRNGVILSLFRFREQIQCRTALRISLNNALFDALPQLFNGCNKNLWPKEEVGILYGKQKKVAMDINARKDQA